MYENANSFMLWMAPDTAKIRAAQFTDRAPNAMLQPVQPVRHAKHEGQWLWTDEKGITQPAVTLFDGVYRPENPHIKAMDRQYRDLALQLRESQCSQCHVPNNPDKMSRLVLLSTPAHAAGEIERLIKSVREDRMPVDEFRLATPLAADKKEWLLQSAEAFRAIVKAAQDWEKNAPRSPPSPLPHRLFRQPSKGDDMNLPHTESRLKRRAMLMGAAAFCAVPVVWSQQVTGERWRLLVNEAVTADLSISMLAMRYRGWAEYMGSQIQNRQVFVDPIIDIQRFVQQALSEQKPLLVFGKSVNQIAKLVRDHGYQPLVRAPSRTRRPSSCRKTRRSRASRSWAAGNCSPGHVLRHCRRGAGRIRRQEIREPYISHTRFQDSVAGQVAAGMAEAGVVNPTIARKWQEGGGRVIGETQPVVNWSVLASPKASPSWWRGSPIRCWR